MFHNSLYEPARKIRLMHLNSYIGYDGPGRGIMGQVKYADKQRFHNVICEVKSTRNAELIREIRHYGCEHTSLDRNRFYDPSIVPKLIAVLKKNRIDILNTHNAVACWYGNFAARCLRIPVVFTLRGVQTENYRYLLKSRFLYQPVICLDRVTMMFADKIVAVSEGLRKRYIEKERIPEEKIVTIHNAVDLETFQIDYDTARLRADYGISPDKIIVGVVGHVVEAKGYECLINASRILIRQYPNTVFLIIGDGGLRNTLMKEIQDAGIANHFLWYGSVTDVRPFLAMMDIFVIPSLTEGLSRALMEAMAMGLPAVCSDIDGNREAVSPGKTGMLFPANDHAALADRIVTLMENKELRKRMGSAARLEAEKNFDIRTLARRYEELYLELASQRQSRH